MKNILVIDDNEDNLLSLKALISDVFSGFGIFTAASGPEGIELAKTHHPDVILLDILMPGMDGFEVCKILKQDEPLCDIPVVFVTALKEDSANKVRALEVGAEGFLAKPVDENELIAQVNAMLKIKAANDAKKSEKLRLEKLVAERTQQLAEELRLNREMSEKLGESEARFRAIFEIGSLGIAQVDPSNGKIILVNTYYEIITGYQIDELLKMSFTELTHPDDRKKDWEIFSKAARGEIEYRNEKRYVKKDGTIVWVCIHLAFIRDEMGKAIRTVAICEDITERKQAELQAKRFSRLFENSLNEIYIFSSENLQFIQANEAAQKNLGYSQNELRQLTPLHIKPGFTKEQFKQLISPLLKGGKEKLVFETFHQRKDKSTYDVEVHLELMDFDDENVFVAFINDITGRKQAEEALHRIKWMLSKKTAEERRDQLPPYGDLTELNTDRLILDAVGKNMLKDIADDFLRLLESSSAIYEKNGDYALGIFSSGWCRFMDQSSRELCGTDDNKEALDCGKWLCHDSCWKEASQPAIDSGRPVDIECQGGIHLYAVPIIAGDEVIGAINFGYGDPPQDKEKLSELAQKYKVPLDELKKKAKEYESRPSYIIDLAKGRLQASANLIGEIVSRKIAEKEILKLNEQLEQKIAEKTRELKERVSELERFHDATIEREFRIKELRDEVNRLKNKQK